MTKKILLFSFLSAALTLPFTVEAQKYSNEFMSIGVGARAQGMSKAQSAIVNDATATFWNPAGLTAISSPLQLSAMHAEYYQGIAKYDFIALAKPLSGKENGAVVGLSFVRLGIDQIPYTLNLVAPDGSINYDQVSEFSAADYAVTLSYAQKLKKEGLTVGGNVKVIRRVIGTFANAWGVGADLGLQYKRGAWRYGVMAKDITTTYNAWRANLTEEEKKTFASTNNEIPKSSVEITKPKLILGAAYNTKLNKNISLLTALDADLTTDGQRNVLVSSKTFNLDPHLGIELDYKKKVFLRFGVGEYQRVKKIDKPEETESVVQPNFGVGFRLGRLTVDYALTNVGNVSQVNYSNIFSLKFDIEPSKKKA